MPCFSPLKAWQSHKKKSNGKSSITFTENPTNTIPIELPCGQCSSCRLERSRQWAIRCMHEAQLHNENAFITLTYDDEHLPLDNSLNLKHFQDFMKRLRYHFSKKKFASITVANMATILVALITMLASLVSTSMTKN